MNANFEISELELQGAYSIQTFSRGDCRGEFTKCFEKEIYRRYGILFDINEVFYTVSSKNVIRGMHFQKHNPQSKLVSVVNGKAWDVIVDLRTSSVTYKKWSSIELSADNKISIYIPRGFAHGFLSLEDNTIMLYQCEGCYDKDTDGGIKINDEKINIQWPINYSDAIISERDLILEDFEAYEKSPMEL